MNYKHLMLSALVLCSATHQLIASEFNPDEILPAEVSAQAPQTSTIRISAQAQSDGALEILQHCSFLIGDDLLIPADLEQIQNGRISVVEQLPITVGMPLKITLIGTGPYEGLSEPVLAGSAEQGYSPNIGTSTSKKDGPLIALRINLEKRAETVDKDVTTPAFLRANALSRRNKDSNSPPLFAIAEGSKGGIELAPKGTFANDETLLTLILAKSKLIHNGSAIRSDTYCDGGLDDEMSDRSTYIIGEYMKEAVGKHGPMKAEEREKMINFFVHHHVISRKQVVDYKDYFFTS